ncbi:MAG: nitroreductase family protein [Actinobacteria bacterium]|nr:nitroreductase family protein [Actinomycetota bacterium]MCI0543451.1 nitroreductase family protein [Actinomycetota bacterium]MCI0678515.1 nitroreductase family protein [Actinomycetota bacterium]
MPSLVDERLGGWQSSRMEFAEVLARRRMVRNYTTDPVAADVLEVIAESALRAPSAGNSQAVAVVVVTDEALRAEIAGLADEDDYVSAGFDPWISRAPAHLVLLVSEKVYRDRYSEPDKLGPDGVPISWPVPYWWVDAGAAMMAILLAAVDNGLAAGFLGVHSVPELASIVDAPDGYTPIGVITVGHPAPDRRSSSLDRPRRPRSTVIHHEHWDRG